MYDAEKLLALLICEDYRAVDDNGKPYCPSHDIYKNISQKMIECDSNISAKSTYTKSFGRIAKECIRLF